MTSIFVAKLDFNATEDQLKSLFEAHGRVNKVTIAKDRETGKPRGFAFVEMHNELDAQNAVSALDNFAINGRSIAVKIADDRGNSAPQKSNRDFKSNSQPGQKSSFNNNEHKSEYKSDFKKLDTTDIDAINFNNPDVFPKKSIKSEKKEKENRNTKDAPKKTKMDAYKKSGKGNRFFEEDDDDDFDDYKYNRRNNGWEDDEDEDDNY